MLSTFVWLPVAWWHVCVAVVWQCCSCVVVLGALPRLCWVKTVGVAGAAAKMASCVEEGWVVGINLNFKRIQTNPAVLMPTLYACRWGCSNKNYVQRTNGLKSSIRTAKDWSTLYPPFFFFKLAPNIVI